MRNLRYQTTIGLIIFMLCNLAYAELIYGFNNVTVTKNLTTLVDFDQDDFKRFQKTDNLKLRVVDGNKVIREDAIFLNTRGEWIWNKVLPFSENLKFIILKDNKPISTEYLADTKSALRFSDNDSMPIIKGIHYLANMIIKSIEKKRLPIEIPNELKNCKDKVLVLVFNKETNSLLWQYYGELKNNLTTDDIDVSNNVQPMIVTDEGSCGK